LSDSVGLRSVGLRSHGQEFIVSINQLFPQMPKTVAVDNSSIRFRGKDNGQATSTLRHSIDNAFVAGRLVQTEFNMKTYLVDVAYSLVRNDKWDVMVGAGIHSFDFESSISGVAFINDGNNNIVEKFTKASADVLAPLPNLRLGAIYMINPRWEVSSSVGWLSLEIDQIDGEYTYFDIATEYRFAQKFGIGASYQLANIDVTSAKGNSVDKVDLEFTGPSIYFTYGF
jgi:hypothetical protein